MSKWKGLSAALMVGLLVGCASSGNDFNAENLVQLRPGVTTTAETEALLGAPPVQSVAVPNGGSVIYWRYIDMNGFSGRTGIKEAGLVFSPDGRFVRAFNLVNVPLADADRQELLNPPAPRPAPLKWQPVPTRPAQ